MRTTVNLDPDIVAAIEAARAREGIGISDALNALARRGLTVSADGARRFTQATEALGARVNLDNTAEVLDLLDGR